MNSNTSIVNKYRIGLLPLLGAAVAATFNATLAEDHRVHIHHAVEVEFETERGRVHHLQGSDDLQNWTNVDDGTVGRGGSTSQLLSTQVETNKTFAFFRVVTEEIPADGPAPLTFAGLTFQLDDRDGHDQMQFLTETNGVHLGTSPDPFKYLFARTGTNQIQIETTPPGYYENTRRDVITFTFTAPGLGNWVRDEFRKGKFKDRDVGVFKLVTPGTDPATGGGDPNPPVVIPTDAPAVVTGLAYTFGSGSSPERLNFVDATAGTKVDDDTKADDSKAFNYVYTQVDPTNATLVVTFKPGERDEYTLVYKNGAQGSFVRKEYKNDRLDDTDSGVFTSAPLSAPATGGNGGGDDHGGGGNGGGDDHGGDNSGGGNGGNGGNGGGGNGGTDDPVGDDKGGTTGGGTDDPAGDDKGGGEIGGGTGTGGGGVTPPVDPGTVSAPAALTGLTLILDDDVPADNYVFATDVAGTKTHGIDSDPFTYTYAVTGANTAHLVATFKPGRWSEIDLTFTATGKGTFVRKDFDKGVFKDTKTGKFAQL